MDLHSHLLADSGSRQPNRSFPDCRTFSHFFAPEPRPSPESGEILASPPVVSGAY